MNDRQNEQDTGNRVHIFQDWEILWNCRVMKNGSIQYRDGGIWKSLTGTMWIVEEDEEGKLSFSYKLYL